jgi:ectoine hydroxylase-related dioxygenase (phytanoyl-CoA dioxygenase family)
MPQHPGAPAVDEKALRQYRSEGYVIVRQVFSGNEMAALSEEATRLFGFRDLIDVNNIRCRWQDHVETKECRFDCFDPVIDLSDAFDRAARDERLFDIVAGLYGEPACLFKDKLIYKPPGATGYGLHQDYIGWPSFPRSFVTLLMPIDRATDANGATEVFPGRHQQGYLSAADGDYHELPLSEIDETKGVRLCLEPGDVAVFHGMLPHRSAANRSQSWRRQLYLSYNAQSDGGDQREAHYREFHVWLKKKYAEFGKDAVYFK